MKKYIILLQERGKDNPTIKTVSADGLPEAKHKAFRMLCDSSGDVLDADVEVYELRNTIRCSGEYNPNPSRAYCSLAPRDYCTGIQVKRSGKGGKAYDA